MSTSPLGPFDSLGRLNVVIEAPRGGACRYRFSGVAGGFEVDGLQPRIGANTRGGKGGERAAAWRVPPFDVGYIPKALRACGRRLEVLVLDDAPAAIGCIIPSRFIGFVSPQGESGDDDGLLVAASALSARFSCISGLEEVSSLVWENIVRFYKNSGQSKGVPKRECAAAARSVFLKALERGHSAAPSEPAALVPKSLEVGVAFSALLKRGVHLKSHADTLASGA